jgi:hypothetical protein
MATMSSKYLYLLLLLFLAPQSSFQQQTNLIPVAPAWASNSVNVVVFRKNSLVTYRDTQFIAFYNNDKHVVLGKRKLGSNHWELHTTQYSGNTVDAHNMISIMVDGSGYLHMAWNHHNNPLHYCRSVKPGSLELTNEMQMTGNSETSLSYPEFHHLPSGNLLFFYRDGASGKGNLVINQYNIKTKQWTQLQSNLVDGEGERNAYWQACVDKKGTVHLSWVWRETPDVASNHDLCYARSRDGGFTWENSAGKKYQLPINAASAEYVARIPQHSELINQTSISADDEGNPYIATYWRDSSSIVPQYRLVYAKSGKWNIENTGFRKTAFSLSGQGTKRIPVSRPQVIAWNDQKKIFVVMIFRDEEREGKVSVAVWNSDSRKWNLEDLTNFSVGSWEPTYDTELWKQKKQLHLFVENVEQVDAEGKSNMESQMVQVLEWTPKISSKKSNKKS